MKKFAILCGVVLFASNAALAEEGDIERGQELTQTCAACHGADGNSPSGDFPTIAGQHNKYTIKQLHDFQTGNESQGERGRYNVLMADQVAGLSEQDIRDLAAYFAAQEHEIIGTDLSEEEQAQAQALYMGGDEERGITACAACHGPRGNGMGLAAFPMISGQHAAYTRNALEQFRSEERSNDPNAMMRDIASRLSDEDIELLSRYISGLY
ncbi:cytochrome c4 [Aliidiomarina sedimenti]|uniref:Cytochrome c4 n=1 Tax=Aliidiomarina sedimenti TaxID=1933879 RepID=A0ABY0C0E9_9GAMM|nr:c-type cytochrome [Aliidiomarina sedimenti]RUO30863.1 cytochrome c4 [Aliidiomarina sedimenti]